MFKNDKVVSVTWFTQCEERIDINPHGDRLGPIVEFKLIDVPNMEYAAQKALDFIQHVFGVMGYDTHNTKGEFGEQSDCWVDWCEDDKIVIRHKYWSQEKYKLFRSVVDASAKFHGWEVLYG